MPKLEGRLDYLDSLRGIAALCVFFNHFFAYYGAPQFMRPWIWWFPFSLLSDGPSAVSIFFVLSGFVLALQYFYPKLQAFDLKKNFIFFAISRALRICIPFWGVLFLSFLASRYFLPEHSSQLFPYSDWVQRVLLRNCSVELFLKQATLLPNPEKHLLPQDWTLGIELVASMLVPIFCSRRVKDGIFFFLFALLLRKHWYLFHFALGFLLAKHFVWFQSFYQQLAKRWKWLLFGLGSALYSQVLLSRFMANNSLIWIVNAIGAGILLFLALGSHKAQALLRKGGALYLGRISFSLYLSHMLVLQTFSPRAALWIEQLGCRDQSLAFFSLLFLTFAAVIVCASLCYALLERPAIHWSRLVRRRQFQG